MWGCSTGIIGVYRGCPYKHWGWGWCSSGGFHSMPPAPPSMGAQGPDGEQHPQCKGVVHGSNGTVPTWQVGPKPFLMGAEGGNGAALLLVTSPLCKSRRKVRSRRREPGLTSREAAGDGSGAITHPGNGVSILDSYHCSALPTAPSPGADKPASGGCSGLLPAP